MVEWFVKELHPHTEWWWYAKPMMVVEEPPFHDPSFIHFLFALFYFFCFVLLICKHSTPMFKLFIWMYFYVEEVMLAEENKNSGTSALEGKKITENSIVPFLCRIYCCYHWYIQVGLLTLSGLELDAWQQNSGFSAIPSMYIGDNQCGRNKERACGSNVVLPPSAFLLQWLS